MRIANVAAVCLLILAAAPAAAQFPDPAPRLAAQREAMARLSFIDGVWRGPAWSLTQTGREELVQVERIGPFLDGSVRVIEGRGYMADHPVERLYRAVRALRIYEGATEVQQRVIASQLMA